MQIIPGIIASSYPRASTAFESIATQTLTSNATTITFSSIPSTYKHLQLRISGRITAAALGYAYLQFNNDTGSNYYAHRLSGDGATASATSFSPTEIAAGIIDGRSSTTMTGIILDIHDYSSTSKNKTARSISGSDNNGTGNISLMSGLWMSTSAIDSLKIFGNTYASGSTFALYGIKGS